MAKLSLEVVYHASDLIQVAVSATNGRFSGATRLYLSEDGQELIEAASRLRGFPTAVNQVVTIEFGNRENFVHEAISELNTNILAMLGSLHLKFFCTDGLGHPAVIVYIQEHTWSARSEGVSNVTFKMSFEPVRLDTFANELLRLGRFREGSATLEAIEDHQ